ncbi:MBL fold metallo-hydrolase [bacterium]|nr:MBL fold metallo-hydrolase [bacterium]MBU1880568.1 MBL fold metallo-hydrolase [bacterium]
MKFCILASGSEGNCTYVEDSGGAAILVDAGISMRRITNCLREIGRDYPSIEAVLISHEHSDHLKGAAVLARRQDLPIYASTGTIALVRRHLPEYTRFFSMNGHVMQFGNLQIEAFPVSHDASETVGFRISEGGQRIAIATDLGHVDLAALDYLRDCDAIVLESNHDVGMLIEGPYPWDLKQRIKSLLGHLSNDQAAETLLEVAAPRLKRVVLAHLSRDNNRPDIAIERVRTHLHDAGHTHIEVTAAKQSCPTCMFEVE